MAKKHSDESDQSGQPGQTSGDVQSPMPDQPQGEVKEVDGVKGHVSNADQTHVSPEVTAEELDEKTKQDPESAKESVEQAKQEQKAQLEGSPENK